MKLDASRADALSSAGALANESGEWIVPPVSYVHPSRRFCALCGRPIARRFWQVGVEGAEGIFCDPVHAALRATYP